MTLWNLKKGYKIKCKTYAEFLNNCFNTNYKNWLKSTYNFSNDTVVWMIRIDNKKRSGYRNYLENENVIEESLKPTRSNKTYRMIFEVQDEEKGLKTFIYLGKFIMDETSSGTKHIFKPIED